MNSNRSIRSNTASPERTSPNLQMSRSNNMINRSTGSLNRLSAVREHDNETNGTRPSTPTKTFTDADMKFHRVVFERCADPPERKLLTNRENFERALNYVGYDLLKTRVDELWLMYVRELTFKDFQRILNDEKPIDERTLDEAFKTLYSNDRKTNWYSVDYTQFRKDLLEKGDRFTEDQFERLRRLLGTEGGHIDVKNLTKMIQDNKATCRRKLSTEKSDQIREEIKRPPARIDSPKLNRSNVEIEIEPTLKKLSIPPRTHSVRMKGAFFCDYIDSPANTFYYSIGYSFEIKRQSPIWITVEPTVTHYHTNGSLRNLDIRLFLFQKKSHSAERRLLYISSDRTGYKTYLHVDNLPEGSYEILPVTFGGVLRARSREVNERPPIKKLREETKKGTMAMSQAYRDVLEFIFDVFDFDENKQLDRQEYNLWTLRTTDDEITDEDWLSIREHVKLDVDENISKDKFIKLNEFEIKDPTTSEEQLWIAVKSVGFNYALELDMMCPFNLTVHINDRDIHLKPTSFVELREVKKLLIKFLKDKGKRIRINNPSISCFNYQDDCGSILYAQNDSSANVQLSIQIINANNVALNLPTDTRQPWVTNIKRDATQILWFAHKLESQQEMKLTANIEAS